MKKIISAIILIFVNTMINAQDSLRISGVINCICSGTTTISYRVESGIKQITSGITNGKFRFILHLPEPQKLELRLVAEHFSREISFFGGNQIISVNIDTARTSKPVIKGSQVQTDFEDFNRQVMSIDERFDSLNKAGTKFYLSGKLTDTIKDSLFGAHDKLDQEKQLVISGFVKRHPASPVSAWAISEFFGYDPKPAKLVELFNSLSEQNKHSFYGNEITEIISTAQKTSEGEIASDFTANDLNGDPVSLSSYRGRYVFVDFWASWCGPCRVENPNVVRLYEKYHSNRFDMLSVSLDNNKDLWHKAVQSDKLQWTQVSDLQGWGGKIVALFGIKGIPFNMILDRDGRIVAKNLRGDVLDNKIREILN